MVTHRWRGERAQPGPLTVRPPHCPTGSHGSRGGRVADAQAMRRERAGRPPHRAGTFVRARPHRTLPARAQAQPPHPRLATLEVGGEAIARHHVEAGPRQQDEPRAPRRRVLRRDMLEDGPRHVAPRREVCDLARVAPGEERRGAPNRPRPVGYEGPGEAGRSVDHQVRHLAGPPACARIDLDRALRCRSDPSDAPTAASMPWFLSGVEPRNRLPAAVCPVRPRGPGNFLRSTASSLCEPANVGSDAEDRRGQLDAGQRRPAADRGGDS